ncbi:hypothetical protein JTE90_014689 [Oedothorax gibbosus]|uniref:Protein kinase domain-containing protein n=1 Tax=Oedothorax gibbosus TaxID=931172 RepID=A0AAV6TPL1_9ARAC|nr:hypothetical protein JTE90_014689 [Oedothorax gibbosus]
MKDPSESLSSEKPPSSSITKFFDLVLTNKIKELKNSETEVTPNRLVSPASPGPNERSIWPETLSPLKNNYIFKGKLGKGGFGQVYHLYHKLTNEEVAAKVVPSSQVTVSETDLWPNLQHPKILTFIEQHQFGQGRRRPLGIWRHDVRNYHAIPTC